MFPIQVAYCSTSPAPSQVEFGSSAPKLLDIAVTKYNTRYRNMPCAMTQEQPTSILNPDGSLTRKYLVARGYCCKNGCRHCPYGFDKSKDNEEKPASATNAGSDPAR
jgi:hypothetical protein